MRKILSIFIILLIYTNGSNLSAAENATDEASMNIWGSKLTQSGFHPSISLDTHYVWRGMEMMSEDAVPVFFPSLSYINNNFSAYFMGGYAINGKYAEIDLGISYTLTNLQLNLNDYYYPSINSTQDNYIQNSFKGHWLEIELAYQPTSIPVKATASCFVAGSDDKYINKHGTQTHAYSTYLQIGTFYDFLDSQKIFLDLGMTPNRSCYNQYQKPFSICNIDLGYCYGIEFKNGWTLPITVEIIYNPYTDKAFINLNATFTL